MTTKRFSMKVRAQVKHIQRKAARIVRRQRGELTLSQSLRIAGEMANVIRSGKWPNSGTHALRRRYIAEGR